MTDTLGQHDRLSAIAVRWRSVTVFSRQETAWMHYYVDSSRGVRFTYKDEQIKRFREGR